MNEKKPCESLRNHATKNNYMKLHAAIIIWNTKICYICKEKFEDKYTKDKKHCKVRDHCYYTGKYRGAAYGICHL